MEGSTSVCSSMLACSRVEALLWIRSRTSWLTGTAVISFPTPICLSFRYKSRKLRQMYWRKFSRRFFNTKVMKRANSRPAGASPTAAVQISVNFSRIVRMGFSNAMRKSGCFLKLRSSIQNSLYRVSSAPMLLAYSINAFA